MPLQPSNHSEPSEPTWSVWCSTRLATAVSADTTIATATDPRRSTRRIWTRGEGPEEPRPSGRSQTFGAAAGSDRSAELINCRAEQWRPRGRMVVSSMADHLHRQVAD